MTRKAIPLSTRYAVLCAQADAEMVTKIEAAGGHLKLRYAKVLAIAKCAMTGESLLAGRTEFDHCTPVELGGTNDASNIQALTAKAHRKKTDADLARIVKARHQSGGKGSQRDRRRKNGSKLKSRNDLGGEAYAARKQWAERVRR